jgi:hypothetical protein
MSKQAVLMVTQLGDQEIQVGRCSHAQARLMVKKEHGIIKKGKLYIQLRPVHLKAAEYSIHALRGTHNPQVSQAELDRRLSWFKELVANVTHGQIMQPVTEKAPRVEWSPPSRKSWPVLTPEEQEAWAEEVRGAIKDWREDADLTPISPEPLIIDGEEVFRQTPGEYDTSELQQVWEDRWGVDQKTVERAYRAHGTHHSLPAEGPLDEAVIAGLKEVGEAAAQGDAEAGRSNLSVLNDIAKVMSWNMTPQALKEKWGDEVLREEGWEERAGLYYWGCHALDPSDIEDASYEHRVVWTRGQPVE